MYDKVFLALLGTSSAHARESRALFDRLSLTAGQPKVLYILRRTGEIVQKRLAELCGVREPTLTVLLSGMERKGLIGRERTVLPSGRSALLVRLTECGRETADVLEEGVEELEERCFCGFAPEERAALLALLSRVTDNLKPM